MKNAMIMIIILLVVGILLYDPEKAIFEEQQRKKIHKDMTQKEKESKILCLNGVKYYYETSAGGNLAPVFDKTTKQVSLCESQRN